MLEPKIVSAGFILNSGSISFLFVFHVLVSFLDILSFALEVVVLFRLELLHLVEESDCMFRL
jgi:hypothetical protein